jgi:hypothetical protein
VWATAVRAFRAIRVCGAVAATALHEAMDVTGRRQERGQ